MAGSLIKIDEKIASNDASITLGASNWDSSYDVYMVRLNNVAPDTDVRYLQVQVTVPTPSAGTPDTTANYDRASKLLRTGTTFANSSAVNETFSYITSLANGTSTNETSNAILYLFNFNNSSEYSFVTIEGAILNNSAELCGFQGGFVHTVAQSCDGLKFFYSSSANMVSGTFTLYGLKK